MYQGNFSTELKQSLLTTTYATNGVQKRDGTEIQSRRIHPIRFVFFGI